MENRIQKFMTWCKLFLLKTKGKEAARFLKTKTPLFIKKWLSAKIFRKEIEEANRIYFLLKELEYDVFSKNISYLIRNFQIKKILDIMHYAYEFSPYYREAFNRYNININNINDFYRIPLLDKEIIRKEKERLISKNLYKIKFTLLNTGGSTGEPLEFLVSYSAGYIDYIHQKFIFEKMGYKKGDKIVAFDGSTIPSFLRKKNIYWITKSNNDLPYGRLSYSSLYLNSDTIKYYVDHFLKFRPSILRGYPSFINDIAEYILEKNIDIPFIIKGIQLTAECAFDFQIKNIEKAFKTKVFLQYGHSEQCVYAYTKDNTYEYYCSPFYGLVEVLDPHGKQVRKGEIGEIVATSFYNTAMPFIRYKTGDLAWFEGNENGIVKIKKIEGRTQDFVYRKNGEKISITAIVFGQHYRAFRNIKKWQIVQNKMGEITINIIKGENFSKDDELEIIKKFRNIAGIEVRLNFMDRIELTKRGKFRFVIVDLKP